MNTSDKNYKFLIDEIEKVKFHNRSLLTLLGNIHKEAMEKTTIHEAIIFYDLSKTDLRELKDLIMNYDKNQFAFEQKALMINPVFTIDNLLFIVKSFVNTEMFITMGNKILEDYASKTK